MTSHRRISGNGNTVEDIITATPDESISPISYFGVDIYTYTINEAGENVTLKFRMPSGNTMDIINRYAMDDSSIPNADFNTAYRDNKLFYSFNLHTNTVVTNRAIGVANSSISRLRILTTCN